MNAGNRNTLSMHRPRRRNVTTSMVGLKNGHIRKNLTQNGEPQRHSWGTQKKKFAVCPRNMLVYLRDGAAQTTVHAVTLRQHLQIKLSIPPSHSILTSGQPVPALTLFRQAPGRVATGVPAFISPVGLDLEKASTPKTGTEARSAALEADVSTSGPTRQSPHGDRRTGR